MSDSKDAELSRRERQIMDIVYTLGNASVTQVVEAMSDAPTRTSVRTFLSILEQKGHLKHTKKGREFIYQPTRARKRVGKSTFNRVLNTFFDGSLTAAVAIHLSDPNNKLSKDELIRLEDLIRKARTQRS
jgi:BlaI family transcriptional regulator, penicillinase repressor